MWGEGPKGGSTFDKCFVYEKNLLHGRFVEENTACLIRCGRFQMGSGMLAGHHCLPLTPHRALGSWLDNATLGGLGRKVRLWTGYILICS